METPTQTATPTQTPTTTPTQTATPEPDAGEDAPAGDAEASSESAAAASGSGAAVVVESGNVVRNGSFEEGFDAEGVGLGWTAFGTTDGAVYAWEADADPMHVSHGEYAQAIRIMGPGKPDRYAGIYQTLDVIPGETYVLALHGVIRSSTADEDYDPLAYRVQWAIDEGGGTNWEAIEADAWTDPGWNDVQLDVKWPPTDVYVLQITPQGEKVTLFVRGWSKWGLFRSEGKFILDGVSLQGPLPQGAEMPTTGGRMVWVPVMGLLLILGFAIWELRRARAE
jgi:hypothetical protein